MRIGVVLSAVLIAAPAFARPELTLQPKERTATRQLNEDLGISSTGPRPALQTVAVDALYGGAVGAVVGTGVMLIEQGDHFWRDIFVGAGVGVLAGAAYGVYNVSSHDSYSKRALADRDVLEGTRDTALRVPTARF